MSDDKVRYLNERAAAARAQGLAPDMDLVETLERLLDLAQKGHVHDCALVYINLSNPDENVYTASWGARNRDALGGLASEVAVVHSEIIEAIQEMRR